MINSLSIYIYLAFFAEVCLGVGVLDFEALREEVDLDLDLDFDFDLDLCLLSSSIASFGSTSSSLDGVSLFISRFLPSELIDSDCSSPVFVVKRIGDVGAPMTRISALIFSSPLVV
jgi:hypothetical protein